MLKKPFLIKNTRSCKEAASIVGVQSGAISQQIWKAKQNKYYQGSKSKIFYRLILGLDKGILDYFLDDNNFIQGGICLKGHPQVIKNKADIHRKTRFGREWVENKDFYEALQNEE